jgi:two-component system sensor histidine kinase DesK
MQKIFVIIVSLLCIFSTAGVGQEFSSNPTSYPGRIASVPGSFRPGDRQHEVYENVVALLTSIVLRQEKIQAPDNEMGQEARITEALLQEKDRELESKRTALAVIVFLMVTKVFFMILTYVYWRKKKNLQIVNLQNENRIRELEHQRKILDERNRIAREMHDDLGTTLTTTLMAVEMVKNDPSAKEPLEMIRQSSEMLSGQINEIVWNLNTNNDNLIQLSSYMLRFARKFLSDAGIRLTSEEYLEESAVVVESYKRRSIFLVMKELLNNVVKHSGTKEVELIINYKKQVLSILVTDKGKGFDPSRTRACGNGLNNIKRSVGELDGIAVWNTNPDKGTQVTVEIPLAQL